MIRCRSVEIVKPTSCTWDVAGKVLRASSRACMNAANITQTFLNLAESRCHLDSSFTEEGRIELPKKGKKLDLPDLNVEKEAYRHVCDKLPFLSTRTISLILRDVKNRYRASRFDVLTGRKSSPVYKSYPSVTDSWSVKKVENDYVITVTFFSRTPLPDCPSRVSFILNASKLRENAYFMDELVDGKHQSTIKIVWLDRKKKWMINFSHEVTAKEHKLDADRILHVYPPGNGKILKCSYFKNVKTHDVWSQDVEFDSVMASRKAFEDRRNRISYKYRQDRLCPELKTGSVGHGRKRAMQAKERWQAKYQRKTKTFNQQRAAAIVATAIKWKCGQVHFLNPSDVSIEGYNLLDSWPWYNLEQCIKNKCEENSIKFVKDVFDKDTFESFVRGEKD